jgi:hypothetical protein
MLSGLSLLPYMLIIPVILLNRHRLLMAAVAAVVEKCYVRYQWHSYLLECFGRWLITFPIALVLKMRCKNCCPIWIGHS